MEGTVAHEIITSLQQNPSTILKFWIIVEVGIGEGISLKFRRAPSRNTHL